MRSTVLLLPLLVLTACGGPSSRGIEAPAPDSVTVEVGTPVWEQARARGVDFRAVGQEPGWLLEISDGDSLLFLYDYGADTVYASTPTPEATTDSTRTYRAETDSGPLTATIARTSCMDTMSGEGFEWTVSVAFSERTFDGCGRWLDAP